MSSVVGHPVEICLPFSLQQLQELPIDTIFWATADDDIEDCEDDSTYNYDKVFVYKGHVDIYFLPGSREKHPCDGV